MRVHNQWRRQPFNMVELVLALAVISIAMLSIMSLVPIGANAARAAIGQSYAADVSELMFTWIADQLKINNSANWTAVVAAVPSAPADLSADYPNGAGTTASWTPQGPPIGSTIIYLKTYSGSPVYRVVQRTVGTSRTAEDIDAIVRIWKSPVALTVYQSGWVTQVPDASYNNSVQLNIEVSWPATLAFDRRDKAYYTMEVARQQ